jgi:hypothetical protein
MYELVLPTGTVRCYSLESWRQRVVDLQSSGMNYHTFERTTFGWRFLF